MSLIKSFSFLSPKNVYFGEGELGRIPEILTSIMDPQKGGTVLIITDIGFSSTGIPALIVKRVEDAGYTTELLDSVPQEPYSEDVESLAASLGSRNIRCIIGVGGGSVLDTAKFLSIMLKWGGTVATLMESGAPGAGLPCIMVPTTAGTGSESTPNAIVALKEKQLKVGVVSPFFMPDYVVLDPVMTKTLPPALTASTGVDAYCHVLECYTSKKANIFSDMVALEGIRLIDGAIREACKNGDNMQARADMLLGSFYGGMAIASSGTTAVHALSYPLGGRYRIPHGVSNAILLVPVIDFNKTAVQEKLLKVAGTVGIEPGADPSSTVDRYIEHLRQMMREIKIPSSMTEFGIKPDKIPELSEAAFQVKRLLNNNPREMSHDEIQALYESIL
ncbi:iron-containing alcohol dehydrogenase [Marispirochaeta sp.]|jgi:alcohol dehydrogenase|uniref:iron-containing alcohol dehydrogenase n=1 Tax=Marispirochaeta sp. TaxID=2038653 RepID=UPI0029C6E945|nr:iron-containing alcohol dehydrogenase [Marispirochaeta sp.]